MQKINAAAIALSLTLRVLKKVMSAIFAVHLLRADNNILLFTDPAGNVLVGSMHFSDALNGTVEKNLSNSPLDADILTGTPPSYPGKTVR